jgi:hypothetical protein
MDNNDAMATQQMLCSLSDDPEAWRRAPFSDLYGACLAAKYGHDEPLDPMSVLF